MSLYLSLEKSNLIPALRTLPEGSPDPGQARQVTISKRKYRLGDPYNRTCLGGRDQEDHGWKPALGKQFQRPYL
jgi:hypothetical protein